MSVVYGAGKVVAPVASPPQRKGLCIIAAAGTGGRTNLVAALDQPGSADQVSGRTDQPNGSADTRISGSDNPWCGLLPTFSNILGAQCGLRSHFQPRPAAPQLQPQQLQPPQHPPLLPWCVGEGHSWRRPTKPGGFKIIANVW